MSEFLYGTDIDDEYLHADEHDAILHKLEWLDPDGLPLTGTLLRHTICPPGESGGDVIPDGARIAEDIVDRFNDDCGFEELADNYSYAAGLPDVIAAFQAARDLLVSKQKFRIADTVDARARYEITAIDEDGDVTYTIGEWESA